MGRSPPFGAPWFSDSTLLQRVSSSCLNFVLSSLLDCFIYLWLNSLNSVVATLNLHVILKQVILRTILSYTGQNLLFLRETMTHHVFTKWLQLWLTITIFIE